MSRAGMRNQHLNLVENKYSAGSASLEPTLLLFILLLLSSIIIILIYTFNIFSIYFTATPLPITYYADVQDAVYME